MKYHRDEEYLRNEKLFKNIFRRRFDLASKFAKGNKVLEMGCSHGFMLDLFKENGWETWGVEPSKSADTAKEKGHKIIKNYFEKASLPENYFDLIIANHTLEHMDDPLEVLRKAHKLLKEGGIILIDVPNAGGLGAKILRDKWPYLLPEEHKHQFTRKTLSKLFNNAGFKVIHFESRSGIFEYANPLLEIGRKRFLIDLITLPYSLIATLLNMGDSMSLVGRKE